MEVITIALSLFALVVSIYAAHSSDQYSRMEYAYKLDPKIEIRGAPEAVKNPIIGKDPLVAMKEISVYVLEENNLSQAYVIYADNRVEVLELDNVGNTVVGRIKSGLDTAPDITAGEWEYRYFFVYLASLDGNGNLYLIYTKSMPECIAFNGVSGIEVYGLEKEAHENEDDYAGERMMAREYVRILKELPDYTGD